MTEMVIINGFGSSGTSCTIGLTSKAANIIEELTKGNADTSMTEYKELGDKLTNLINEDETLVAAIAESRRQVRKGQLLTDKEVFGE